MRIVILAGPTAVGKSDLGLALSQSLGGEILAADSMQVYRRMNIGTAKPTAEEQALVPHHLLDLVEPDQSYNAARYAEDFHRAAADVTRRGRLPVVVGGTGLYIRAALYRFLFPEIGRRPEIRSRLQNEADAAGPEALHARLRMVDPEAAARIHPRDARRIVRALEVYEESGRPISAWQRENKASSPYDAVYLYLTRERRELYRRIEARTDQMLAAGFLQEVESLLAMGFDRRLPAMQGIGYRELGAYLAGEMTLPAAVELIKRRTRNYAKRQMTWFRHEPDACPLILSGKSTDAALTEILRLLAGRWGPPSNS
ncbi:MAG: tRNA (adenosine(37)-N6)-dimethylallyltransferase MiaA [Bacteroidota bacterium]